MSSRRWKAFAADAGVVALVVTADLIPWLGDDQLDGAGQSLLVVAMVLAVHSSLPFRHRHPRIVFGLEWVFAFCTVLIPQLQPFAGLLVALHATARSQHELPRAVLPLILVTGPFGVHAAVTAGAGRPGATSGAATDTVAIVMIWMIIAAAVWVLGRLRFLTSRRDWRLRELDADRARESLRAERSRIARDLHDTVTNGVTAVLIQAAAAQAELGDHDPEGRTRWARIETIGVHTMTELHRVLDRLTAAEESAGPTVHPTVADIAALTRLALETGHDVRTSTSGVARALDPETETTAYRVVQEGLTNSMKHAGPGARTTVGLTWTPGELVVDVQSYALVPTTTPSEPRWSSGRGIAGLRQRVIMVGGTMEAGPNVSGYRVRATLPVLSEVDP